MPAPVSPAAIYRRGTNELTAAQMHALLESEGKVKQITDLIEDRRAAAKLAEGAAAKRIAEAQDAERKATDARKALADSEAEAQAAHDARVAEIAEAERRLADAQSVHDRAIADHAETLRRDGEAAMARTAALDEWERGLGQRAAELHAEANRLQTVAVNLDSELRAARATQERFARLIAEIGEIAKRAEA